MTLKRNIRVWLLEWQRNRLIPDAYWDEVKRIKLCRIDAELIRIGKEQP